MWCNQWQDHRKDVKFFLSSWWTCYCCSATSLINERRRRRRGKGKRGLKWLDRNNGTFDGASSRSEKMLSNHFNCLMDWEIKNDDDQRHISHLSRLNSIWLLALFNGHATLLLVRPLSASISATTTATPTVALRRVSSSSRVVTGSTLLRFSSRFASSEKTTSISHCLHQSTAARPRTMLR